MTRHFCRAGKAGPRTFIVLSVWYSTVGVQYWYSTMIVKYCRNSSVMGRMSPTKLFPKEWVEGVVSPMSLNLVSKITIHLDNMIE